MLIYLKGVSRNELEPVLGFLYNGEASIAQEELKQFIMTGNELQVKGLDGEITAVGENLTEPKKYQVQEELISKHKYIQSQKNIIQWNMMLVAWI